MPEAHSVSKIKLCLIGAGSGAFSLQMIKDICLTPNPAGGSQHVMHDEAFRVNFYQFRLFESIVKDIADLCPYAWLLLVANPVMAATTLLGRNFPDLKMVGLSHGSSAIREVARIIGLDPDKITF